MAATTLRSASAVRPRAASVAGEFVVLCRSMQPSIVVISDSRTAGGATTVVISGFTIPSVAVSMISVARRAIAATSCLLSVKSTSTMSGRAKNCSQAAALALVLLLGCMFGNGMHGVSVLSSASPGGWASGVNGSASVVKLGVGGVCSGPGGVHATSVPARPAATSDLWSACIETNLNTYYPKSKRFTPCVGAFAWHIVAQAQTPLLAPHQLRQARQAPRQQRVGLITPHRQGQAHRVR